MKKCPYCEAKRAIKKFRLHGKFERCEHCKKTYRERVFRLKCEDHKNFSEVWKSNVFRKMDWRHWVLMEWKDSEIELPPKDGHYQVMNRNSMVMGICFYDGHGFLYEGKYREPDLWRDLMPLQRRYGKVNPNITNL